MSGDIDWSERDKAAFIAAAGAALAIGGLSVFAPPHRDGPLFPRPKAKALKPQRRAKVKAARKQARQQR